MDSRLLFFQFQDKEENVFQLTENYGKMNSSIKETIKSAKSSPKIIVHRLITSSGNIFNTVGHTCSGETLVEGLVEL